MDIIDYLNGGIIGESQLPIGDCVWLNAFLSFLSTKDALNKAVNEYYRSSVVNSSLDRRYNIIDRNLEFLKEKSYFDNNFDDFWNSMISLNYSGIGYVDGDIITEIDMGLERPPIYYKTYAKSIYDKYISDMQRYMASMKILFKSCSSGDTFEDYIKPTNKIYDFTSNPGDFEYEITNNVGGFGAGFWDYSFRIVTEGDIEVGSYIYYINTIGIGYKSLLSGSWTGGFITLTDLDSKTLTISEFGNILTIDAGFTFDSVTDYIAPVI